MKSQNYISGILVIILTLPVFSFSQVTAEWKEHKVENIGFTIKYPPTWTLKDKSENAIFFITSPKESTDDQWEENFNLQYRDLSDREIDLKAYVKYNVDELKTFDNFKIVSEKSFFWFGKEMYEIIFTGNVSAISYKLKWKQWYVIYKKKGYVITYCTEAEKKDKYEVMQDRIFKSIRIK